MSSLDPQTTGRLPQSYGRADLTARGGGLGLEDVIARQLDPQHRQLRVRAHRRTSGLDPQIGTRRQRGK